jgi:ribonuclease-3 family protein
VLARLREEFDLTEKEKQVLSRGRNGVSGSRNNRRNPAAYQDSTALEALIGFLYITDSQRCGELMNWLHRTIDTI